MILSHEKCASHMPKIAESQRDVGILKLAESAKRVRNRRVRPYMTLRNGQLMGLPAHVLARRWAMHGRGKSLNITSSRMFFAVASGAH